MKADRGPAWYAAALDDAAAATSRYAMSTAVYEAEDTVMGRVVA